MTLKFSGSKSVKKFDDVPNIGNGQYPARVVQLIDLGVQHLLKYKAPGDTSPDEWQDKAIVRITYEFPTKRIDITKDGETESRPRWLGKEYTYSSDDRGNLRKSVDNIISDFDWKNGDLADIVGKPCMVAVGTTSGGKDKVVGVNPTIEGLEVGELENPVMVFDMDDPDMDVYNKLPRWLQKRMLESCNVQNTPLPGLVELDS